jgi:hypothetical protein
LGQVIYLSDQRLEPFLALVLHVLIVVGIADYWSFFYWLKIRVLVVGIVALCSEEKSLTDLHIMTVWQITTMMENRLHARTFGTISRPIQPAVEGT